MIQPIVEGHGEVSAVPILMRRLGELMGLPYVHIAAPIRRPRSKLVQESGLQQAIELAKNSAWVSRDSCFTGRRR